MALKGCSHNVDWVDTPELLPLPNDPRNVKDDLDYLRWNGESKDNLDIEVLTNAPDIIVGTGLLAPHRLASGVYAHRRCDSRSLAKVLGVVHVNIAPNIFDIIHAELKEEIVPQFCGIEVITRRTKAAVRLAVKQAFKNN